MYELLLEGMKVTHCGPSQINNANFKAALVNSLMYANLYAADTTKYDLDINLLD